MKQSVAPFSAGTHVEKRVVSPTTSLPSSVPEPAATQLFVWAGARKSTTRPLPLGGGRDGSSATRTVTGF
jgi:hypothetical protein